MFVPVHGTMHIETPNLIMKDLPMCKWVESELTQLDGLVKLEGLVTSGGDSEWAGGLEDEERAGGGERSLLV